MTRSPRLRRVFFLAGLAAAFAAALTVRLAAERSLRGSSPVNFVSPDCLYHMRRAELAVRHFPRVLLFDPTMNFPQGGVSIWPPLFDLALATPARIIRGLAASHQDIARLASLVPPLLGALAALAAGLAAASIRRAFGVPVALFVALCGAHVQYSQYGHTDQHVAESLTSLIFLASLLRARRHPGPGREIAAGIALGLTLLTWQGAVAWAAMAAACLAIDGLRGRRDGALGAALRILGTAVLLDAAGVAFWTRGDALPFAFVSFGWFQPFFVLALMAGVIFAGIAGAAARRALSPRALGIRLALFAAAIAALAPRAGGLWHGLVGGLGDITRSSRQAEAAGGFTSYPAALLKLIYEARPLLKDGPSLALSGLGLAAIAVPPALLIWFFRAARKSKAPAALELAAFGLLSAWLVLNQRLYIYYAAPLAGLAAAEIIRQTATRLGSGSIGRVRGLTIAGWTIALASLLPGLRRQIATRYEPGQDLLETMAWANANLPHPIDWLDERLLPPRQEIPELASAESVLCPWALGHFVTYDAELPVVANNFGYGFEDSLKFFLATNEDEALAIARRRRVRWILATDLTARMNDYGEALGRGPYVTASPDGARLTPGYFETIQSRLYDFDGAGPRPLPHLRLIHQSRTGTPRFGRFAARWKLFVIDPSPAPSVRTLPKRDPAPAAD